MWHAGCGAPCVAWCVCEECLPAGCAYFVAFRAATNCRQPPRAAAPAPAGGGGGEGEGGGRRRQAATHVSAVQIRLRQFTKHETRQSRGVQERGGEVDRKRGRSAGVGEANKHFRKLHAFVKTKQCAKCLFVLVSAFQRKNDSAQKRQSSRGSSRGGGQGEGHSTE